MEKLKREAQRNNGADKKIMDLKFKIEELEKSLETVSTEKTALGTF